LSRVGRGSFHSDGYLGGVIDCLTDSVLDVKLSIDERDRKDRQDDKEK
jgi:hypothetical protein